MIVSFFCDVLRPFSSRVTGEARDGTVRNGHHLQVVVGLGLSEIPPLFCCLLLFFPASSRSGASSVGQAGLPLWPGSSPCVRIMA
jgi:hypothetical protein